MNKSPVLLQEVIDFWISNNLNVLLVGKAGVGKTALVKSAFERAGIKARYFSSSTMDPWVDFIGVPRVVEENQNKYLELIRPKEFAEDEVEALFFDEFNRAPKKVRNAVMELIQFKSVNGKKFKNLRMVWAAINPYDTEDEGSAYDVEPLDPAQIDRFHVQYEVPYRPSYDFFKTKYGEKISKGVIEWWESLPQKAKNNVSPRRLEYAIDMYIMGGNVQHVLPLSINAVSLVNILQNGSVVDQMYELYKSKNKEGATKFIKNDNNYFACIDSIINNNNLLKFYLDIMPKEKIAFLVSKHDNICNMVCSEAKEKKIFEEVITNLISINNKNSERIRSICGQVNRKLLQDIDSKCGYDLLTDNLQIRNLAEYFDEQYLDTTKRISIFNEYMESIIKQPALTIQEAERALFVLNAFVRHTHEGTLATRLPLLKQFVENVFNTIISLRKIASWYDFTMLYPYKQLYNKLFVKTNAKLRFNINLQLP